MLQLKFRLKIISFSSQKNIKAIVLILVLVLVLVQEAAAAVSLTVQSWWSGRGNDDSHTIKIYEVEIEMSQTATL